MNVFMCLSLWHAEMAESNANTYICTLYKNEPNKPLQEP